MPKALNNNCNCWIKEELTTAHKKNSYLLEEATRKLNAEVKTYCFKNIEGADRANWYYESFYISGNFRYRKPEGNFLLFDLLENLCLLSDPAKKAKYKPAPETLQGIFKLIAWYIILSNNIYSLTRGYQTSKDCKKLLKVLYGIETPINYNTLRNIVNDLY